MDWLDRLTGYAQQGAETYATIKNAQTKTPTAPATTSNVTPINPWLMPAIIGGAVLVLVLVFVGRK